MGLFRSLSLWENKFFLLVYWSKQAASVSLKDLLASAWLVHTLLGERDNSVKCSQDIVSYLDFQGLPLREVKAGYMALEKLIIVISI